MSEYEDLLEMVLEWGKVREDRTGVGTISMFGTQTVYDLENGFPLITTKKVHFKSVVAELLWMLSGSTNINDLDASIWNEWADEDGSLGPVYGAQWRMWGETLIDQIANVVDSIRNDPMSRRHIVTAWNPADLDAMALPPCHMMFQFYVQDGKLSCMLYQRSADLFLGVPFNIASYALLTHIVANLCGLGVGEFIHTIGDAHIYLNHVDQVREQLSRAPLPFPELELDLPEGIQYPWEVKPEHIKLHDYMSYPAIKGEVAV